MKVKETVFFEYSETNKDRESGAFTRLIDSNTDKKLELFLEDSIFNYIDIQLDKGLISIERRPTYCDRGRYVVKVFSNNSRQGYFFPDSDPLYVDSADGFPRYYFRFDNLISEIQNWTWARMVFILSVKGIEPEVDK